MVEYNKKQTKILSSFSCVKVLFPLYHSTLCMKARKATCLSTCTPGLFQSQFKMFYFSNLYFPGLASCGTSWMAITQISLVLPLSMSHVLSILCTALHVFLGVPEEPHKSPNPVFSVMPTPLKPLRAVPLSSTATTIFHENTDVWPR